MSLSSDMNNDLDLFFDPDDFGTIATYNGFVVDVAGNQASVAKEINGIFDERYAQVTFDTQLVDMTRPVFTTRLSSVPNARPGDILVMDGVEWKVIEVQPDGTGIVMLVLSKDES